MFFFLIQRVQLFSAYAMSAMCQAGFDVIDVYPLTDSYPNGIVDAVHYPNKVFDAVETMLEKYRVHNNTPFNINTPERRIKRCISWNFRGRTNVDPDKALCWYKCTVFAQEDLRSLKFFCSKKSYLFVDLTAKRLFTVIIQSFLILLPRDCT